MADLGRIEPFAANGKVRPISAVHWSHSQWPFADQKAVVRPTLCKRPVHPIRRHSPNSLSFPARPTRRRVRLPIGHMTLGVCGLMMSCSFWPICSPIAGRLTLSVQTTVLSLRRTRCGNCSPGSASRRCPSNATVPGRIAREIQRHAP